jgi:hypothetical protein
MSHAYKPKDALELLRNKDLIRWACSPRNPAFHQADARTRDAHGRRVYEYLAEDTDWPATVRGLVCGPLKRFGAVLAEEPVRLSSLQRPGRQPRVVAIPTFLRRCMSNLMLDVLTKTCDHKLPAAARAYRKGDAGVVRESILDVAQAVVEGNVLHFAKLDIANYFPSIPWALIYDALVHYGFGPEFIDYLLALIGCPLVRLVHSRVQSVPNTQGAQMGLAESSFLANMVPFEVDSFMKERSNKVFYLRYSDDLFIGSKFRHEVVGAVRFVQGWCRRHGFAIKGASPDTQPTNFVHDVRRERVEFLGVEIDQNGTVNLPKAKLVEKLAKLGEMASKLAGGSGPPVGEHVQGVSRYGGGDGVDLYDADDLRRSAEAFSDYWMSLDLREASRVDDILRKRFPMLSGPSGTECGTVWSARLCADQAVHGAETQHPVHPTQSTEPGCPSSEVPPSPPQADAGRPLEVRDPSLLSLCRDRLGVQGAGDGDRIRCKGSGPCVSSLSDGRVLGREDGMQEDLTDVSEVRTDVLEDGGLYTRDGDGFMDSYLVDESPLGSTISYGRRFHSPSEEANDLTGREEKDLLDQDDLLDLLGAAGDTADEGNLLGLEDESPVLPWLENSPVVHVAVARVKDADPPECLVAHATSRGGVIGRANVRTLRGCNHETATVLALTDLVRDTRAHAGETLHVALGSSWLPKLLLQPRRAFRSPQLLHRVLVLHDEAAQRRVEVTVTGACRTPGVLERALAAGLADIARERALADARSSRISREAARDDHVPGWRGVGPVYGAPVV